MKWDLADKPHNVINVNWSDVMHAVSDNISAAFIVLGVTPDNLEFFLREDDGAPMNRAYWRWRLQINSIPEKCANAHFPNRSVQATFYGANGELNGNTYGATSVWENHDPENDPADMIRLEIDFAKTGARNHEIGLHVLVLHGVPMVKLPHSHQKNR